MTKATDFVVTSYVQNAHIIRLMQQRLRDPLIVSDVISVEGLGRVVYHQVGDTLSKKALSNLEGAIKDLVSLRILPVKADGTWTEPALFLATLLSATPEELWPGELKVRIPEKRSNVCETSIGTASTWVVM
jgi:hypothetical protein